jgi:hypothetical protein
MYPGRVLIRRPTAEFAPPPPAPSFTVDRPVAGLRVGVRTDSAWRSWQLIATRWAEWLRTAGATVDTVETQAMVGPSGAADRSRVDELAGAVDCAISGLGTCGSCTSFTVADAVTFEDHDRPVIAVVTEEFETHARNVAAHLGHGALKVLVLPYPLEARSDAELEEIAARAYPEALALLGVTE